MSNIGELYQSGDWKNEKHAPVIELPAEVKAGESFKINVSVGKEIPHPNTVEHHIAWIQVYFLADGAKFPVEIGRFDFDGHGESAITDPDVTFSFKTDKPGKIIATSYCNLHGLWESEAELKL